MQSKNIWLNLESVFMAISGAFDTFDSPLRELPVWESEENCRSWTWASSATISAASTDGHILQRYARQHTMETGLSPFSYSSPRLLPFLDATIWWPWFQCITIQNNWPLGITNKQIVQSDSALEMGSLEFDQDKAYIAQEQTLVGPLSSSSVRN